MHRRLCRCWPAGSHNGGRCRYHYRLRRWRQRTLRRLANGTNYLPYQLYKQDGSTVWSSASPVSYTSTSKAQAPLTLVGKIPAGADIPAGSYSDTVVATINF